MHPLICHPNPLSSLRGHRAAWTQSRPCRGGEAIDLTDLTASLPALSRVFRLAPSSLDNFFEPLSRNHKNYRKKGVGGGKGEGVGAGKGDTAGGGGRGEALEENWIFKDAEANMGCGTYLGEKQQPPLHLRTRNSNSKTGV